MKKLKICVYGICRDEMKFLDKWLENMSEADYICVLDTGSTDGSFEKLKEDKRVTKVEQKEIKPWRFDVARNESMKLVPEDADILVCTDMDELFNKGWATNLRNRWAEGLKNNKDLNRAFYSYAWSHSGSGEPTDVFSYDKCHTRDFHWIFPVHEVLYPNDGVKVVGIKLTQEEMFLQHYQDKNKDRKFYFDLLEVACKERPDDSHLRMLLAREYLLNKNFTAALENYLATLQLPDVDKPDKRLVLLESLSRVADCYMALGNYEEAIWYCEEFIKEDYTYREPYLIMAQCYGSMNMNTLKEACAKLALEYGTRKTTWVERADSWTYAPYLYLGEAQFFLGKLDDARNNLVEAQKHEPNNVRILQVLNAILTKKVGDLCDSHSKLLQEMGKVSVIKETDPRNY